MENRVAFLGESHQRQSRATRPTVPAGCFSLSISHRTLTWSTGSSNVRTNVNACGCTRGCTDARQSLHWKLTLGEKSLAVPGNRICLSGVPVRRSTNWATSPPDVSDNLTIWSYQYIIVFTPSRWGIADAEIIVPTSAENQNLWQVLSFESRVSQKIALQASHTARFSA